MKGMKQSIVNLSICSLLAVMSSSLQAAGYKLEFQNPAVLADAGDAAVVNDAGTNWYNSAGLVYLPQQLAISSVDVYQQTRFSGSTIAPAVAGPSFFYVNHQARASSYPNSILPAFHYTMPFSERYAFGLSVVPAWGLMEDYGETSDVRYSLNKISTKTLDVAPSLAMKINERWSIGLGPDFHYFSIESKVHARTEPLTSADSVLRYNANNWGKGWHAGVLFRFDDATRVGLNYRSKIVMNMTGNSDFVLTDIANYHTDQFKLNIPLPPTTTLSVYHDMTPTWALMGTVAYDQWDVVQYYYGQNVSQPTGPTNVVLPQKFKNTFDFSIGTHYKLTEQLMLRSSLKYEPTPTVNSVRSLTFPDSDKLGINIGAHYQLNKKLGVDMIYAHVFTRRIRVNDLNPLSSATAVGHVNTSMDIVGAQLVWDI